MSGLKKMGLLPLCLAGIAATAALTALICLALASLILRGALPQGAGPKCAEAAVGISIFISVWITARLRGRQPMAAAGVIAGGTVLLAALVCALGGPGFDFGPWLLRLAAWAMAGGIIGAVMSLRNRTPKRRRRRP